MDGPMSSDERQDLMHRIQSQPMGDEERQQLMRKLDDDLQAFIAEKAAKPKAPNPDADKTVDEIAEELLQHPAFMESFDPSKPLSPEMEALQALKYDSDSAEEKAESYKEDGNQNFKRKKYRWAIDNYTEGIKAKCKNKELNAILYSNRAAAHFHIGNYRSAFNDCLYARKFKQDHMKAIIRGAQCCLERKKYDEAISWCDDGLEIAPNEVKLLELRPKADKLKRQQERDLRRELAEERKTFEKDKKLLHAVKARGIKLLGGDKKVDPKHAELHEEWLINNLKSNHKGNEGTECVRLDENNMLHWPVLFLYPEYGTTDFINSFDEHVTFSDQLSVMFTEDSSPAPWDEEEKYKINNLEIYFENMEEEKLYKVKPDWTLSKAMTHKKFVLERGVPGFIIIVKDSIFAKRFLAKYHMNS